MSLEPGTRLSHYTIAASIGVGGMGEVYRARDEKLGREVAIKVRPAARASDPERLARFKREAQVLASLNHSNIAQVNGLEAAGLSDGSMVHFLAMELVEGEDLAERLKRGAIPPDEAIASAKQIAEGLEDGHEHDIVHRDLKPTPARLALDGKVKILDFGLAEVLEDEGGASEPDNQLSRSPTMPHPATETGMILGTVACRSPEQARGKTVDKRTDIWSFGVLPGGGDQECVASDRQPGGGAVQTLPGALRLPEPLRFEPLELLGHRGLDQGSQIAVGNRRPHQGLKSLHRVVQLLAGGELDLIASRRHGLHGRGNAPLERWTHGSIADQPARSNAGCSVS